MQPEGNIRLDVQDLTLSWDGRPVCADINLQVAAGQVVCLVGRSGTGKTTLFHAIAGLTLPDSGRILLDGHDITGVTGKVGYMQQKDLLLDQYDIAGNVSLPLVIGGMPRAQAREQAAAHMPTFGLQGCEKRYPFQLSGGMRQRAALLRTYLMGNDMVLMDEPFSALDAFTRVEMRTWLLEICGQLGFSLLVVTHDVDEAIAMADRILVLAGDYTQGHPSTIVGAFDIECPRAERAQVAPEIRSEILQLLV